MNDTDRPLPPPQSQLVYWVFQATGWGIYTLSQYIGGITVIHLPWARFGLEMLLVNGLAFGLSHRLRDVVRRGQWRTLPFRKLVLRILAAAFACGIPLGVLAQFTDLAHLRSPEELIEWLGPALQFKLALPVAIAMEIVNWAVVFLIWLTLYFLATAVREYRSAQFKQSELTRALQLAELKLLKTQLNPHFLFNALNTVRSLIADNPGRAQSAVTHLANTLRYTLSSRQDELVTLSQEMAIVADYLELESMRFEDRLHVERQIPADAAGVRIPVMLLQTLVENAIKHGIADLPAGGVLRIGAAVQDEVLNLEVVNTRAAAPAAVTHGVGLRNARDRLRLLFGERASLVLDLSQPGLAIARLRVPVKA